MNREIVLSILTWGLVANFGCHESGPGHARGQFPAGATRSSSAGGTVVAHGTTGASDSAELSNAQGKGREPRTATTTEEACTPDGPIPPEFLSSPRLLKKCFLHPEQPLYRWDNLDADDGYQVKPPRHEDCSPNDNFCVPAPTLTPPLHDSGRGEFANCWGTVNLVRRDFSRWAGFTSEVTKRERMKRPNVCCYHYQRCR